MKHLNQYFLATTNATMDELIETLHHLNFGTQGHFIYEVSTFNFMETTAEELNQKKLVILIPFQLLKLRKLLEENRCPENLNALQNLRRC